MKKIAGINGCGRFGLHLLRYWLNNIGNSLFDIKYLNDEVLTLNEIISIIEVDDFLDIKINNLSLDTIQVFDINNVPHRIRFSKTAITNINWLTKIDILFECSGKYKESNLLSDLAEHKAKKIVISASSSIADQMLIFGFNHQSYRPESKILSYGSCTINAYVPLANFINKNFGITDSDCSVIHNCTKYKIHEFIQPKKQQCTLENYGPKLLDFLSQENFRVSYTTIGYLGVSLISFRFSLSKPSSLKKVIDCLENSIKNGELKGLYSFTNRLSKPNDYKFTSFSSVLIKDSINIVGTNLYIDAFFDNENSVNRLFDLSNFILEKK